MRIGGDSLGGKGKFYNARWYDPYLNQFTQPDNIIPNLYSPGDLNRYAYVRYNPVRYTDPSGNHYCDSQYAAEEACDWYNQAPPPDDVCLNDFACYEAYLTYNELIFLLQKIPTVEEILYMTAQAEGFGAKGADYTGSGTFEENFVEGLARNYWEPYEACREGGTGTCSASKLYKFMSGYQPWFDRSKSPLERARYLAGKLEMDTYRAELESAIQDIVDPRIASENRWTDGMWVGEPWQWHNWWRAPKVGVEAIGWIYYPNQYGNYFWIMTADQTIYFQREIKPNGPQ